MSIRIARKEDIAPIQHIRNAVKENTLSDPSLVTDQLVLQHITELGKGWVYELDNRIVGFAIVTLTENNVWALFLLPEAENKGIGKALHHTLLDWYFSQTQNTIWLSTTPGTRADGFYRKCGWREVGPYGDGEIKFEMTFENWQSIQY